MAGIVILKLQWNHTPKVPDGYASIWPLFTVQIGNQQLVEKHWPTIQKLLQARHEALGPTATNEDHAAIDVKAGNRVAYYTDSSIEVFR